MGTKPISCLAKDAAAQNKDGQLIPPDHEDCLVILKNAYDMYRSLSVIVALDQVESYKSRETDTHVVC